MTSIPAHSPTRDHYDAHPLDFLSSDDEAKIAAYQPAPFRRFVERMLLPGQLIADIGCGPGRATLYLQKMGMNVYSVDLSKGSLELARKRAPAGHYICATNLALPIRDEVFDAVVSDGVLHHTIDARAAFLEDARLVTPGGYLYVGVYRRYRYYYYVYTYVGVPVRWVARHPLGRMMLHATLLPLYFLVHLVKSRGKRTWNGAKNFFYDYILTPRATFHTFEEVCDWGASAGMKLVEYDENVGNVHAFVFRRTKP